MNQQERPSRVQEVASDAHPSPSTRSARTRPGCSISFLTLLLGLLAGLFIGALGTLLYISSAHDASAPTSQPAPGQAAIVIQLTPTYLSQVITKEISSASVPGNLKNIQVTMAHNAPVTISGDDQFNFMGLGVTRHITMQMQPVVHACQVQVGITHADFSGIPVTSFVSPLEQQINQQLSNRGNNSLLPKGFIYCATDVHTETNGIFVTYSARSA
jgi:hypothetical protein